MSDANEFANPLSGGAAPGALDIARANGQMAVDNYCIMQAGTSIRKPREVMDERKYRLATAILDGAKPDEDSLLAKEAAIRNITPTELAKLIVAEAEKADAYELWRIRCKVAIGKATSKTQVIEILNAAGIPMNGTIL